MPEPKTTPTDYIVLKALPNEIEGIAKLEVINDRDGEGGFKPIVARSKKAAIKMAVGDFGDPSGEGTFVVIPARSFQPIKRATEQKVVDLFEGGTL